MRIRTSGLIFLGAAFPFIIPLVPSTDTQPTFSLFVLLFAGALAVQCISREVMVRKDDLLLAGAVVGGGLIWLCISLFISGAGTGNVNRIVAFLMLLIAIAAGVMSRHILTEKRISQALKAYAFFTLVFFLTHGKIESFLIKARGDEISRLLLLGRGASTLSPEPSFFAFQIFTLFLAARLTIWTRIGSRSRHFIQLMSIVLLLLSFSGFGAIYALLIIFLSGRRYIVGIGIFGTAILIYMINSYKLESLRFIKLGGLLVTTLSNGVFKSEDASILGRLSSFQDYLLVFHKHPFFGDAFGYYGGGGLVSVLAALGLFGLALVTLVIGAILFLRTRWRLKLVLLVWLTFQFISGPVGMPMVGLMIGFILRQSRLGALLSAMSILTRRRRDARSGLGSFA